MFKIGDIVKLTYSNEFFEITDIRPYNENTYQLAYEITSPITNIVYITSINNQYIKLASKQEKHNCLLHKFKNVAEN